jgi:hypothetical protein
MISRVAGYASSRDRELGREAAEEDGEAGRVTQYCVDVTRPMLAAPNVPLERATLLLDTTAAGAGYPMADPIVMVTSRPVPFTPRVYPATGLICIGNAWRDARGRILLAHLVVHVLHWVGFDEPINADRGYHHAAFDHWRDVLRHRPLACSVPYPVLPEALTHGQIVPKPCGFAPASHKRTPPTFAPRAATAGTAVARGVFRPARAHS